MTNASHNTAKQWSALIGLSLLAFTAFLDLTLISTAIPFIQTTFGAKLLHLQWVLNVFAMVVSMSMIVAGRLGDLFGRRKLFYWGFLFFVIATIGAGLSASIAWLVFFRGLQGVATAIIFTLGPALLPQAFPQQHQTRAIGVYVALTGIGMALGPLLGGVIITLLGWRWVFFLNIPIIVMGFLLCLPNLCESPKPDHTIIIDWAGLVFWVIGVGALVFGVVNGEQMGWSNPITLVCLLSGVTALMTLLFVEQQAPYPLLDFSLFKIKQATLAALMCMGTGLVSFSMVFFDALYFRTVLHFSALKIGALLFLVPLMQVVLSLFVHRVVHRFGVKKVLFFGVSAALLSGVMAAFSQCFFTGAEPLAFIIVTLLLMGFTWGMGNTGAILAMNQCVPPSRVGGALGMVFTLLNVSGAIFLALSTALFHATRQDQGGFLVGFHAVMGLIAGLILIIFLASLWFKNSLK